MGTSDSGDWIKRIGSCPQDMLNMANSRACRSAIMFNDSLSKRECEELVGKLAECRLPFMCAHGRPSMVPLIELGDVDAISAADSMGMFGEREVEGDFADAFARWQNGMEM